MDPSFWRGKRVFITGHTGFKGSWLSLWLAKRGAMVFGYALPAPTTPSLFVEAKVEAVLAGHTIGDLRAAQEVAAAMARADPEIVFHLGAQPLVRYSYTHPVETYATNVMGTVHVLEAARQIPGIRALVNVTTDKCYDNKEWVWGYRETDTLGGHDPYANSKACSELVTAAYRASFLHKGGPWLASARAGNVIGGGDWAADRLIPDIFRALVEGTRLTIRSPHAIRPWQHVLEPLSGYITLAEALVGDGLAYARGWNFGPADTDAQPVGWIVRTIARLCPTLQWESIESDALHETHVLKLDSAQAHSQLGWSPRWPLARALEHTVAWHQAWQAGADLRALCDAQIADYEATQA